MNYTQHSDIIGIDPNINDDEDDKESYDNMRYRKTGKTLLDHHRSVASGLYDRFRSGCDAGRLRSGSSGAGISHSMSQPCLPVSNLGPTKILPFLFLGSQVDALSPETMNQYGITYILNVSTSSPKPSFIQDGHFLRLPVNDTYMDRLVPFFDEAFQFLDKVREANGCVLVHCLAGISRSPTVAIAYVMSQLSMTTDEAYRYVKDKRPTISPNFNFLGQLVEYEQRLNKRPTTETSQELQPDVTIKDDKQVVTNNYSKSIESTSHKLDESLRTRCERAALDFTLTCAAASRSTSHLTSCIRSKSSDSASLTLAPYSTASSSSTLTSPTTALSRLTFSQLSPLEEQSPPSFTTPHLLSPPASSESIATPPGVIIRLGPKHCGATKRPLSSPSWCGVVGGGGAGFGVSLALSESGQGCEGGSNTKRRPLARPNSISVVPVVSSGGGFQGWSPNVDVGSFDWLKPSLNKNKNNEQKGIREPSCELRQNDINIVLSPAYDDPNDGSLSSKDDEVNLIDNRTEIGMSPQTISMGDSISYKLSLAGATTSSGSLLNQQSTVSSTTVNNQKDIVLSACWDDVLCETGRARPVTLITPVDATLSSDEDIVMTSCSPGDNNSVASIPVHSNCDAGSSRLAILDVVTSNNSLNAFRQFPLLNKNESDASVWPTGCVVRVPNCSGPAADTKIICTALEGLISPSTMEDGCVHALGVVNVICPGDTGVPGDPHGCPQDLVPTRKSRSLENMRGSPVGSTARTDDLLFKEDGVHWGYLARSDCCGTRLAAIQGRVLQENLSMQRCEPQLASTIVSCHALSSPVSILQGSGCFCSTFRRHGPTSISSPGASGVMPLGVASAVGGGGGRGSTNGGGGSHGGSLHDSMELIIEVS